MTQTNSTAQLLRTPALVAYLAALPTRGKVTIEAEQLRTLVNSHLDLADERAMMKQAVEQLEEIGANWRTIIEESDPDGYPLIENLLYLVIDDLGGYA